jgi:hypothetical protein
VIGVAAPPSVKRLAAELVAQGIESQYLARVLERVSPDESLDQLQAEIVREMAQALGRSEDRVNVALAELELHKARYEQAVREAAPVTERQRHATAFNAQRTIAQTKLRELLIHREALGFRRNQVLSELYPIPPKVKD